VLGDDAGELGQPTGSRIALHDAVQHGHEMALAGAEAAVKERRLGEPGLEGCLEEPEGLVAHAIREFQHEIITLD
jgi:hypothetical protein